MRSGAVIGPEPLTLGPLNSPWNHTLYHDFSSESKPFHPWLLALHVTPLCQGYRQCATFCQSPFTFFIRRGHSWRSVSRAQKVVYNKAAEKAYLAAAFCIRPTLGKASYA